jgi:hypothetical protein
MGKRSRLFEDIHDISRLAGTKFWDAVMGPDRDLALAAASPAVSDPEPTVVVGGEAHVHVDDRTRCEAPCLDCENDIDGCGS